MSTEAQATGKTEKIIERLKEVKPRNVLILVLDEGGRILNLHDEGNLAELFGFNKKQGAFLGFITGSTFMGTENLAVLINGLWGDTSFEAHADLMMGEELRHFHFSIHCLGKIKIFLIREETELTLLKRQLEAERKAHLLSSKGQTG